MGGLGPLAGHGLAKIVAQQGSQRLMVVFPVSLLGIVMMIRAVRSVGVGIQTVGKRTYKYEPSGHRFEACGTLGIFFALTQALAVPRDMAHRCVRKGSCLFLAVEWQVRPAWVSRELYV